MPAMQSSSSILMPIDVVSDVVCPWCFIGKRRLEKALALRPEIAAEVERGEPDARAAEGAGVHGLPCSIFGNVLAVSGAQDPASPAEAMGRAAAQYAERGARQAEPQPG